VVQVKDDQWSGLMETDPLEMHNLAGDPEHQVIRKQHWEMLEQWCRQTGDKFW
jgi:hypothetical protein